MRHVLTIEPTVALAQDPRNSEKKVLCCAQCFIDCPAACIVGITDHLTRNKVLFVHIYILSSHLVSKLYPWLVG